MQSMSKSKFELYKELVSSFEENNVAQKRMDTCSSCEHFFRRNVICTVCGCPVVDAVKKLEFYCPVGKFDSATIEEGIN